MELLFCCQWEIGNNLMCHPVINVQNNNSLKTGVFPGNYVQHIKQEEEEKRRRRKEDSDKTIDEIIDLDNAFGVKKGITAPPPNVALGRQQGRRKSKLSTVCSIALDLKDFHSTLQRR